MNWGTKEIELKTSEFGKLENFEIARRIWRYWGYERGGVLGNTQFT